jgi:hypothetical protein
MSKYHDEFDKGKFIAYLVLFAMAVCLLTCSIGCGVRSKTTHSFVEKVDSTFTQVKKESSQEVKDSAKVSKQSEIKEDSSSLNIVFADNIKSDEPVVIEYDTIGRLVIHSGGRIIKSITTTKKRKESQNKADSAHVVNSSNVVKSDSTNIDLSKSVKSVSSKKFVFAIPWYAYVIGVAAIGLTWFFWSHIKTAKAISDNLNKVK